MLDLYVQAGALPRPGTRAVVLNDRATPATSLLEAGLDRERLDEVRALFPQLSEERLSIWGMDGRIKWVNPAHERATGFSGDELIGRPYVQFIHPDDRDLAIAQAARLARGGTAQKCDLRVQCSDGSYRRMLVTATPSPDRQLIYAAARDSGERETLEVDGGTFMALSLDLLCVFDLDGRLRRINPAVERLTGSTEEELLTLSIAELVHPGDAERMNSELLKLGRLGAEEARFTARIRTRDGSYAAIEWNAAASAERGMIFAIGREHTDRLLSEQSLREADERFKAAFDQAPIGMALISIEKEGAGVFLRVNRALCDITGYSEEYLIGSGFHSIAHPADYDPDLHYVPWMVVGEVSDYEVEKRLLHAEGHTIWAQLTTSIVRDGEGRPIYLISQIQDVTERKQAERDALESSQRLQSIIDNTTALVYTKDREGRYGLINRRYEMLHGIRREETVGKTYEEVLPPDVAEAQEADDLKVLHSGLTLELEEVVPTRDGPRTFLTTKFPLVDPDRPTRTPYAVCAIAHDITDRKRAEEALRASEEHFRQIVNTAHDAFVAMDTAGVVTAWNPKAEETFGWTELEAVGQSMALLIIPPRYREAHFRGLERFLETGRGALFDKRFEMPALHRDGHEFPIELTITPLRINGAYVFNAFMHDISDRKAADEQIRLLADIVESSGDAIVRTTPEGVITAWNRGAERQFGYASTEAVGKSIEMLDGPDQAGAFAGTGESTLAGNELSGLEIQVRHQDGRTVDVSLTVSLIRDPDGGVAGLSYIARDITERKAAERAVRDLQDGFRAAFDHAPIGVALESIDPQSSGALLQVNRSLCEITGHSAHELLETTLERLTHPDDLEEERKLLSRLRAGEISSYSLEKRYLRPDGSTVWVMHNASTVYNPAGRMLYVIAQVEDISDRKAAQESLSLAHDELERRAQDLERSNTDLQQFAYAASHDLSEPLRMVRSYVQLLARRYEGKLDADADEFIEFAVDGVTRMQALIDGLLMYSRAGTSEYAIGPVDCSEIVEAALMMLKARLDDTEAEIVIEPLPTVQADEAQLAQLFQNLIGNAVKFVSGRKPRVEVSAERREDEWCFSVADNGIGIDPKHADRIFAVFQRLQGRGEYEGSGIGLAICKRIVERHGGRIWVESQPGEGSTFRFTIPDSTEQPDNPDNGGDGSHRTNV
jgi:PAS domain S-box-containing protein